MVVLWTGYDFPEVPSLAAKGALRRRGEGFGE